MGQKHFGHQRCFLSEKSCLSGKSFYLCGMKTESKGLYPALNLPPAQLRLTEKNGKTAVFDILRKRYVALTPEEWVRQHFVHYLTDHLHYPATLLGNEVPITLNGLSKRCDTVLLGTDGLPHIIIEYKRPSVALTQKVFDQIWRYNLVLRVKWLIVSNGLKHVVCRFDIEKGTYDFLPQVPLYEEVMFGSEH